MAMIMNADGTYGEHHQPNRNPRYDGFSNNFERAVYYISELANFNISNKNKKRAITYLNNSHLNNQDKKYLTDLIKQGDYNSASIGIAEIANHE